jgi:hypothetical protein
MGGFPMRKFLLLLAVLALQLTFLFQADPAHAQATRTWVSGVGDDANPCSRTAPCKTFAGTISKTATGGEINCIDPGGFGALTIVKAITIDCSNTEAGVLVAGTNGIVVSAGAGDVVTLRGLDFFGTGTGLNGILFNTGAALIVEKCTIRSFQAAGTSNGYGILFQPSAASILYVTDTQITNNGSGTTGGGIMIRPTGSSNVKGWINRVSANNNISGISADGGSSTGKIQVTVSESVAAGASSTGFSNTTPNSGGATTILNIDRSTSIENGTGINAAGPNSAVLITRSTIFDNVTGLSATGGGAIYTYTNNDVIGNGTDGSPTNTLTPK